MPTLPQHRIGRGALVAAALACVLVAVLVVAASFRQATASPAASVDSGTRTCVTSSTGFCTVRHDLGAVPNAVVATVQAPVGGSRIAAALDVDQLTAATFRVRAFTPAGSAFVGTLTLSYVATVGAVAPPTSPPPTTTAPPTTTVPPTTTATPPPGSWPTADTTGVPAGTALTTVNGDLTVDADNATVDARDVQGSVIVNGANVTITRTRIHGVVFNRGGGTLRVTDSEVTANPGESTSVGNFPPITGQYALLRVHVHRWQDGPRTDQGTVSIRDSLVDELAFAAGEHPDAVQQFCIGCTVHATVVHNTLSGCAAKPATDLGNSALFWSDHPGPGSTLDFGGNLVSCGQFTIRVNDTGSGIAGNSAGVVVDVHDNVVVRGSYAFGPAECDNSRAFDAARGDGVKWSGNTFDDGAPLGTPCAA